MTTWIIEQLWVKPSEGSLTDVVVTAAWRCNGTQTTGGKQYYGTCYGTASFTAPDPSDFVPYLNLTQDEVLGWVWASGVDKTAIEANVQQQIDLAINPPIITPPLPWNTGNQP